jgi:PBSX family phage terminase large subunit
MTYLPTKRQGEAWKLLRGGPRHVLLVGGSRSGKTTLIVEEIIWRAIKFTKSRHLIARLRFAHAKNSLWLDTIPKLLQMEGIKREHLYVNESDHYILFPNGSEVWVDGLDDKDRIDKILGREYTTIFLNEISQISYNTVLTVLTRLAQTSVDINGVQARNRVYYDLNPVGKAHWGYKLFLERKDPINNQDLANPEDYASMTINPDDNRDNLPTGYIEDILDRLPEHSKKRFRHGEWCDPEGVIFSNWEIIEEVPSKVLRHCQTSYGLDFGFCVDEETEILTKDGWKRYDALTVHEEVLTLNKDTGFSEWQEIDCINVFKGNFLVWHISGKNHDSVTTENHEWIVEPRPSVRMYKRRFKKTKDLSSSDGICCAAPCADLPEFEEYSDAFVELVAWFYTEGSIYAGAIHIYQNEGPYADRIRSCLTRCFGPAITKTRNGRKRAKAGWVERDTRFRWGHTQCCWWINLNGSEELLKIAPEKVVSFEFLRRLTRRQLELFLDVSMYGDGHTTRNGYRVFTQSKLERVEPLQFACTLLGLATSIRKYFSHGFEQYSLNISKNTKSISIGELIHRRPSVTKYVHKGIVWCPSVENRTWLARRNGNVYFTGNSVNPSALIWIGILGDELYLDELVYETGLTNQVLGGMIRSCVPDQNSLIYADSAEPKSITELQKMNINVRGAAKGPDSVRQGLDWLLGKKLFVTRRSSNLQLELENYEWKKNRDSKTLPVPIDDFDHCLVAGTMISTMRGDIPIEEVNLDDFVLTRNGPRQVLFSGVTGRDCEVVKVTVGDSHIICTPDHRIFAEKGLTPAHALRYGDGISTSKQEDASWWKQQSIEGGYTGDIRTISVLETADILSALILMHHKVICIGRYGKIIMGRYLQDMQSIISTVISTTMTSRILSACPQLSMQGGIPGVITEKSPRGGILTLSGILLRHGIPAKRGKRNTEKMGQRLMKSSFLQISPANSVERSSLQRRLGTRISSALEYASRLGVGLPGLIMSRKSVNSVGKNSSPINSTRRVSAPARVRAVEPVGRAKTVYDLTIEDEHEFFANGILVSNSIDAIRYGCEPFIREKKFVRVLTRRAA